ncbi:hypothetical protein FRC18_008386 [Serendipita sp. 400]|nr:hypothetical protein FRC18_008386 [Serendipita sp. 400]
MNIPATRCTVRISRSFVNTRSLTSARPTSASATGHTEPSKSRKESDPPLKNLEPNGLSQEDVTTSSEGPTSTTHYKITLHRSAIGLPKRYKDTLISLGIRRRGGIVFHEHCPSIAGKILRVKELVKVENVTSDQVKTPREIHQSRQPVRGYVIKKKFWESGATSSTSWLDGL